MRQLFILLAVLLGFAQSSALAQDVIKPGTKLSEVQSVLKRHHYKFGEEHSLAMVADDPGSNLFYCQVDSDIVLIAVFKKSTGIVTSMSLAFFPARPTSQAERVVISRNVRKVVFDDKDAFTVSIERVFRKPAKEEPGRNPFDG
jgi:hypothetical protein